MCKPKMYLKQAFGRRYDRAILSCDSEWLKLKYYLIVNRFHPCILNVTLKQSVKELSLMSDIQGTTVIQPQ